MAGLRRIFLLLVVAPLLGAGSCEPGGFRFLDPRPGQLGLPGSVAVLLELPWGEVRDLELQLDALPVDPGLVALGGEGAQAVLPAVAEGLHELVATARWHPPFPLSAALGPQPLEARVAFELADLLDPERCETLNDLECLLPYPSSLFLEEADTPTGYRVELPVEGMPIVPLVSGVPLSPAPWRELDGFGPGTHPLFFFPDVDLEASGAPVLDPVTRTFSPRSLEPDSPTLLLDAETGERILHFVELDARIGVSADKTRQVTILRPGITLEPGGRYVVAVRRLVHGDGSPVEPEPVFAALRDRRHTTIPSVEARRDHHEDVFGVLEEAGVPRDDLLLAFDFVIQSRETLTSKLLHMRDVAYDWLEEQVEAGETLFTVSQVEERDCSTGGLWRDVQGTFRTPLFLDKDPLVRNRELGFLLSDADGLPTWERVVDARFTVLVPCSVLDGERVVRPLLNPHGGGSDFREPRLRHDGWNGALGSPPVPNPDTPLAAPHFLIGGADNHGFGRLEFEGAAESFLFNMFFQPNGAAGLTGRVLQGQVNLLVLGRLMKHALLNVDPAFQTPAGAGVFPGPEEEMYMWGVSFGGFSALIHGAVSPDVDKLLPAVAVVNFANQSQRDVVFDGIDPILPFVLGFDSLTHILVTSLSHDLWAQVDPIAYQRHLVREPLRGVQAKPVLLAVGEYDQKSPNVFSDVAARDLELASLGASSRPGLGGIPDVPGPLESAYVSYWTALDPADPAQVEFVPPLSNTTAKATPACDPHILTWLTPAFLDQAGAFFRPGGEVESFCEGPCDGLQAVEREFGNPARCDPNAP